MDVKQEYEDLIDTVTNVYGIDPVRTSPFNLGVDLDTPAIAVGWNTIEPNEDEFLSDVHFQNEYLFAYYGENETGLLNALTLLKTLLDELPYETKLVSGGRIKNVQESKSLDYGFSMIIRLKEVI